MKNAAYIKEAVKGMTDIKLMIIKKHEGAIICEMEKSITLFFSTAL